MISGLGIGQLLVLFVMGTLSDKFARKPFVFLGGIANSTLDARTYPALMESFPKATGTVSILTKSAIAGGQFVLPIIMTFIFTYKAYFGCHSSSVLPF